MFVCNQIVTFFGHERQAELDSNPGCVIVEGDWSARIFGMGSMHDCTSSFECL